MTERRPGDRITIRQHTRSRLVEAFSPASRAFQNYLYLLLSGLPLVASPAQSTQVPRPEPRPQAGALPLPSLCFQTLTKSSPHSWVSHISHLSATTQHLPQLRPPQLPLGPLPRARTSLCHPPALPRMFSTLLLWPPEGTLVTSAPLLKILQLLPPGS